MKKYYTILEKSLPFSNIPIQEYDTLLSGLSATVHEYAKNEFIFHSGEATNLMGIVLTGAIHIIKEDYWGNRNILSTAVSGELFAEVYACTDGAVMGVSVVAAQACIVIFLDARRIFDPSMTSCKLYSVLVRNLLSAIARKTLMINEKLSHISQRTTRDKLLSYLSAQATAKKSSSFEIPFDRQQLADYLSVDRSALSRELCSLRDEGMLVFAKNRFSFTLPRNF